MQPSVVIRYIVQPLVAMRRISVVGIAIAAIALLAPSASAAEQSKEFLEALRSRGYFSYAIDYLDWMKTSPLVSSQDKETIGYELGVTLVDSVRVISGSKERESQLARAETELNSFLKSHKKHSLVDAAVGKLSEVNILRAGERLSAAKNPKNDRKTMLAESLKYFDAASKLIEQRHETVGKSLAEMGAVSQKEKDKLALRDELRGKYIVAKLAIAKIERLKARAYEDAPKKRKEQLAKAADAYGKIFNDYPNRGFAYIARNTQAQCYQDLGDPKKALECYQDVIALDDINARGMKTDAYKGSVECWIDDQIKELDKALDVESQWLLRASLAERRQERWLALTFALARAHEKNATVIAEGEDPVRKKKTELGSALRLATEVSRIRNTNQEKAREMISRIRNESGAELAEPETFVEAIERADSEYATVKSKKHLEAKLKERIELEDEGVAELQKQRKAALAIIGPAQSAAIKYYKLALRLADGSEDLKKINRARFTYCYLLYLDRQFFESAIVAGYLARQYPQSLFGANGAQMALAAWGEALKTARQQGDDITFEAEQIASIAEFITETWSDDRSKTDGAYITLARIMVDEGKPDEALMYLQKISPDSDKLGPAYIRTGQALSRQFTDGKKKLKKGEAASPELTQIGEKAKQTLADGIARMSSGETVSLTLVYGAYYLAQLHININEPDEAIAILENPKYGPLTLFKDKQPSAKAPIAKNPTALAISFNSLAVRAFISGISIDAANLDKAQAAITRLEGMVSADQLSAEYSRMARELRLQLDLTSDDKKRREIAKGFDKFLLKMRDGKGAEDFNTLVYVLNQYTSLAQGSEGDDGKVTDDAEAYYKKAVETGQRIVDLVEAGKIKNLPAKSLLAVKVRLGTGLGKIREYKAALKIFEDILTEKPALLSVQLDAAKLYGLRGRSDPKFYRYAIGGGEHFIKGTDKRIIWGFAKTSKIVKNALQQYPNLEKTLHESRYHHALTAFKIGKASESQKERTLYLENARNLIFLVFQNFPAMGGPTWASQYDSLLKQIQRARNQKPVNGLKAFGFKPENAEPKENTAR